MDDLRSVILNGLDFVDCVLEFIYCDERYSVLSETCKTMRLSPISSLTKVRRKSAGVPTKK